MGQKKSDRNPFFFNPKTSDERTYVERFIMGQKKTRSKDVFFSDMDKDKESFMAPFC